MQTITSNQRKLIKTKRKLDKITAKYNQLRMLVYQEMQEDRETIVSDTDKITFAKSKRCKMSRKDILLIKDTVSAKEFDSVFNTQYQLQYSKYSKLKKSDKLKKILDAYVDIVNSPLGVTIKEE